MDNRLNITFIIKLSQINQLNLNKLNKFLSTTHIFKHLPLNFFIATKNSIYKFSTQQSSPSYSHRALYRKILFCNNYEEKNFGGKNKSVHLEFKISKIE